MAHWSRAFQYPEVMDSTLAGLNLVYIRNHSNLKQANKQTDKMPVVECGVL